MGSKRRPRWELESSHGHTMTRPARDGVYIFKWFEKKKKKKNQKKIFLDMQKLFMGTEM